jgi:anti-anti-sigma factor
MPTAPNAGSAEPIPDDIAAITVAGELDLALSAKVTPEINAAIRSSARAVLLDLGAVTMMDSSGLGLLVNAYRRLDHASRALAIACPPGAPRRALELTGLDRELPLYETREQALAALS